MVFSSPVFLFLFLPLVLALYFSVPRIAKNGVLLVASLLFYAWGEPKFAAVMLASVMANYLLGMFVERFHEGVRGKLAIAATIVINIGLLAFYKYGNFAVDNLNALIHAIRPQATPFKVSPIELPLGISFFTFHALSYVIDIYRGDAPAQRHPFRIALYISFFPQLVAGPIVRYHEIADQLLRRKVTREGFAAGAERFMIGLGKKMLIANTVAVQADAIFKLPASQLTTGLSWIGVVCYTLQIYFDFSGYSDMAIGLAQMFGFQFPENFNYPYVSKSLTEFWRRWHISLSNWFRDYLYIPLGGNRKGKLRTYLNLVTIFFLCGLWHGASWNYVVWGLFHGTFLVIERMGLSKLLERAPRVIRHGYTILLFMCGWVFFRAATLDQAATFFKAMVGMGATITADAAIYLDNEQKLAIVLGIIGSAPWLPFVRKLLSERKEVPLLASISTVRLAAFSGIFLLSAMRLSAGTYNPFIYFRF